MMTKRDTRLMLDKIKNFTTQSKKGNLSEQQIEQSQAIDNTESPINPEVTQPQNEDIMVINNVDVKFLSNDKSDLILADDQKQKISEVIDSFKSLVSQTGNLEPGFTFTPGQIRLDGELGDEGIKFVFIAGSENGIYINAEMMKLEQNIANILEKMVKYQSTFETVCDPIINDRNTN